MAPYKAIIFDLYGTLVEFPVAEYEALVAQLAALLELPITDFVREWKSTWNDHETGFFSSVAAHISQVSKTLNTPLPIKQIHAAEKLHNAFQQLLLVPKSGSVELLTTLKRQGYKTGLISNCPVETNGLWPQTPLSSLIDVPIFSTVERIRKPALAIFALAAARLQIESHECAFIGDSWHDDVLGAHNAGMAAFWLNPLRAKRPDRTIATSIASLAELLGHLH